MNIDRILSIPTVQRCGGLLLTFGLRAWMRTIDYRGYFFDESADSASPQFAGPVIYLLWHEYVLTPLYLRSRTGMGILTSRHRDAEILSQFALMQGLQVIRGSTGRGGAGALKEILSRRDFAGLAITPDGPRGPRREMAAGAIFLASKLEIPLVLAGIGYDAPWRYRRAWDQFAVPRLGSRIRVIMSPRIFIPPDLTREEIEAYRIRTQQQLNQLTEHAENWASDHRPRLNSRPMYPAPTPRNQKLRNS